MEIHLQMLDFLECVLSGLHHSMLHSKTINKANLLFTLKWEDLKTYQSQHEMTMIPQCRLFCIDLKGVYTGFDNFQQISTKELGCSLMSVMPEIQAHNFYGHFDRRVAMGSGTSEGDGTGKFLWCHQFQQPLGDRYKIFHSWFCQCGNLLPFCLSKHRRPSHKTLGERNLAVNIWGQGC